MENKTIAAISTPEGKGGISIIRLSGDKSFDIAGSMFSSYSGKTIKAQAGYTGMLGEVIKDGKTIDQVILFKYKSTKSYTGEDIVELSCHGGGWVASQILRLALDLGATPAAPGEFTKRAFLNGKMDLLQAQSVMDIINATTQASLREANNLREGVLSTKIDGIVESIIDHSAHLAAWSDYPDEDMEMVDTNTLYSGLSEISGEIGKLLESYDYGRIIKEGVATVIVGKPNVGKSTLMNMLTGYSASIVSDIPGTTRDVVKETIRLGNITLQLADTAGIRETFDMIESVGVELAKKNIASAQLVLALFDNSQPLEQSDYELIELIRDKKTIALINKSDLDSQIQQDYIEANFDEVLVISAKAPEAMYILEETIEKLLALDRFNQDDSVIITNERQRQGLVTCKKALEDALAALESGITLDAVGVCLDFALEALLILTGKKVQEEVVSQVFAQFCVGK